MLPIALMQELSVVYLLQQLKEVSDTFSPTVRGVMQGQLKEGEGEAPREAEVGDWTQRWQTWRPRNPPLWYDPPSCPQPSPHHTCTQNSRPSFIKQFKKRKSHMSIRIISCLRFGCGYFISLFSLFDHFSVRTARCL